MTYNELLQTIDEIMVRLKSSIASDPNIPRITGNLANSIKIRQTDYGYEIYLDTGNKTTKEWEENPTKGTAPYGVDVEQKRPYWNRLAMSIRDQINYQVGATFNTEKEVKK